MHNFFYFHFQIPVKSSDDSDSMKSSQRSQSESENAGDSCIPFPRTCGAKWCGVNTLVVFNRPSNTRRLSLKQETGTPRSMSSLSTLPSLFSSGYSSVSPHATTTPSPTNAPGFPQLLHRHPSNSITTFYFQDRWVSKMIACSDHFGHRLIIISAARHTVRHRCLQGLPNKLALFPRL